MNAPNARAITLYAELASGARSRIELALTRREHLSLMYLIASMEEFVSEEQLFGVAYGMFDRKLNASTVRDDMRQLREKLTAALGVDPIASPDGARYRITEARLSLTDPALGER